ncbi:Rho termination factor N-terminal domain-containing protein [Cytophagaceae bacterium ABcell3]|nr:Rho termination factor N-terminal domain-containing protein [Cytophagaceae bacterium ABcell3]
MKGTLDKEGKYEIFETVNGSHILVLNEQHWYAIVKGKYGHILVATDSNHKKNKTVQKGDFYKADFRNNPEFNDIPHLFLRDGKTYKEFLLPNDLPDKNDRQKKLVITKKRVQENKVKKAVKPLKNKNRAPAKREDLKNKSKQELYEMAKEKDIPNRSKMNKRELVKKLK